MNGAQIVGGGRHFKLGEGWGGGLEGSGGVG